jgi:hypothetical protein
MKITEYFDEIGANRDGKKDADLLQMLINSHRYLRQQNGSYIDLQKKIEANYFIFLLCRLFKIYK